MATTPVVSSLPSTQNSTTASAASGAGTASQNANSTKTSASLTGATTKTMGKDDFLKLLTTQLRYQDPLNPQDPKDFVSQLSQFSSLEQQINANTTLQAIGTLIQSVKDGNGMSQGVAMLGKTVTGTGNSITVAAGRASTTTFNLPQEAKEVTVTVYDASGKSVRTLNLGRQAAGTRPIAWDGKNDQGAKVADGAYSYTVSAKDSKGQNIGVSSYFTGVVQEVYMDAKGVWVKVNGQPILIDNITAISQN
jgi:flagellar basal-body rod modification protein FlgD